MCICARTYKLRPCTVTIIGVWELKCHGVLHNAAVRFILEKKMATGSDIALLCGFRVTQARAARQERQQQEGQTRVANLATSFPDWEAFQTASATSNRQKPLRTKLATFFWSLGEGWHRHQDILAPKVVVITSPQFMSLTSNVGCCKLSRRLEASAPGCSRSTAWQRPEPTNLSLLIKSDVLTFTMLTHIESNMFICRSQHNSLTFFSLGWRQILFSAPFQRPL